MSHGRCRKVRYVDEVAARVALARIQARDVVSRPGQERRAYECPRCRSWHLTSMNGKAS